MGPNVPEVQFWNMTHFLHLMSIRKSPSRFASAGLMQTQGSRGASMMKSASV